MNEMIIHFQLIGLTQRCYIYYSPADRTKNAVFQVWHSSANRKIHLALKKWKQTDGENNLSISSQINLSAIKKACAAPVFKVFKMGG